MFLMELFEGLEKNDLDYLISDVVSVDQYEGKISKDSIVVVFYVKDKDAAKDLEDFIQRYPSKILLITELSSVQDKNNYFHLFLDFERRKEFVDEFLNILSEIKNLTNVKEWRMKIGKNKFIYRVNKENLLRFLKF